MDIYKKEFPCPKYGSTETVSFEATKAVFPGHTGHTALTRLGVPVTSPGQAQIIPRILVVSNDICAVCGTGYCTQVEVVHTQAPSGPPTPKLTDRFHLS